MRVVASGVPVYCRHDDILAVEKLKPNPQNPNQHPATQIKKLLAIIKANGWRMPITVSTRSGMITKGHGRLTAAESGKLATVPVEYQAYRSEAEEWADVIADNQLPELAETSEEATAKALKKLRESELDFSAATGYDESEFDKLLKRLSTDPEAAAGRTQNPTPPPQKGDRKTLILHYDREEHEEFEKLSTATMKAYELLTVSDTILRLVTEAAK
jgi:hypothetical protein